VWRDSPAPTIAYIGFLSYISYISFQNRFNPVSVTGWAKRDKGVAKANR